MSKNAANCCKLVYYIQSYKRQKQTQKASKQTSKSSKVGVYDPKWVILTIRNALIFSVLHVCCRR